MEASLTCAVCLGVFRDPVTLPLCSHNFCKNCVLECGDLHGRSIHPGMSVPIQVTCPLCRKISSIPGGLSALPVNTTLAELVRLLSLNGGSSREHGAEYSERGLEGVCPDHPEHKLELFCKNCAVPCCGKCVSCNHQGIFHNINLLDMVYQEEKLIFFNSLKKLRETHESFTKNTDDTKDIKETLRKNIDMVNLTFDEAYKALDLKKKQCLEFIKQKQNTAIKRHEVHKTTMAHHKSTIESLLKDCESLVDEFEPKCFLQMACSLNKRMTSNLDLMELAASHDQDIVNTDIHVDLKAVLEAISAVTITACASNAFQPKLNGILFKTITRIWKPEQTPSEKYSPVQRQELCYHQGQIQKMAIRLLSITEMPEYKHLSFEELRLKYYEDSVIQENNGVSLQDRQGQSLPNVEDNFNLGTAEAHRLSANIRKSADFPWVCSTIKNEKEIIAKNESKMEIVQEPQKAVLRESVFQFPAYVAVRAKEPENCSLKGVASGMSLGNVVQKDTEVVKETNNPKVVPNFCFGKSDATSLIKPSKNGKSWKKPKTAPLLQTTASAEPLTNKPFLIFSSMMDFAETKVTDLFCNPFSQQECKEQKTENKSFPEDHTAQSSSCEEFYDANSDAEETEQAKPSKSTG